MRKIGLITALVVAICCAWVKEPVVNQQEIILAVIDELKEQKAIDRAIAKDTIFVHFLDTAYVRTKYYYHKNVLKQTERNSYCEQGAFNRCLFIYSDKMKKKPGLKELTFKFVNASQFKGTVYLDMVEGQYEIKKIVCCDEVAE